MDTKVIFGLLPVLIAFPSYYLYVKTVLNGKTKPHMYSWLIWSLLAGIGFLGQLSDNAGPGAWNTGVTVVACFIIFLLSVRYGERLLNALDKVLLCIAAFAILALIITSSHTVSVLLATFAALIGFAFTSKKAYKHPNQENPITFSLNSLRNFLSLFALNSITFLTFFYPLVMMLANLTVALVIYLRRRKNS